MAPSASTRDQAPPPLGEEISVVIPAYNEAGRIGQSLERIFKYCDPRFERYEVLVIDDGSTDGTIPVVQSFAHPALRCLKNEQNRGKGFSVRRGMQSARYDPVLFTDADLSTPIEETENLLRDLRAGSDLAIASRWCRKGQEVKRTFLRQLKGKLFSYLVRLTTLRGFHDTQCGFKMFRREVVERIFSYQRIDRWGFDVEILFIAKKRGLRIQEVPVRWYQSKGTRVGLLAPFTMTWELIRIRANDLLGRYEENKRS
jgi:glycosyltransferase involved in cell wall biosynthesis